MGKERKNNIKIKHRLGKRDRRFRRGITFCWEKGEEPVQEVYGDNWEGTRSKGPLMVLTREDGWWGDGNASQGNVSLKS